MWSIETSLPLSLPSPSLPSSPPSPSLPHPSLPLYPHLPFPIPSSPPSPSLPHPSLPLHPHLPFPISPFLSTLTFSSSSILTPIHPHPSLPLHPHTKEFSVLLDYCNLLGNDMLPYAPCANDVTVPSDQRYLPPPHDHLLSTSFDWSKFLLAH